MPTNQDDLDYWTHLWDETVRNDSRTTWTYINAPGRSDSTATTATAQVTFNEQSIQESLENLELDLERDLFNLPQTFLWTVDTTEIPTVVPESPIIENVVEEPSMPIDYSRLDSDQRYSLNECLQDLDQKLSNFSTEEITYVRDGNEMVLEEYDIRITPEFDIAPGAYDSRAYWEIKRLRLDFNVPQEHRAIGVKYVRYLKYNYGMDMYNLHAKITDGIRNWGTYLKRQEAVEAEPSEAEVKEIQTKIEARKKKMDELKEKAQKTYERFMELLSNNGVSVESTKEDEIINVALPNKVKMRLNVYGEEVSIQDIEVPKSFSPDKINDFISVLQKFTNI